MVPPTYRRVRVRVTVTRSAGDDTVAGRVTSEIRRHLDPLVGGPDADGWPFGGAVRPSDLIGVAARAAGAEATVTRLAVALDDGPETDCGEVVIGPRDLVWLAGAQVDTHRRRAIRGRSGMRFGRDVREPRPDDGPRTGGRWPRAAAVPADP